MALRISGARDVCGAFVGGALRITPSRRGGRPCGASTGRAAASGVWPLSTCRTNRSRPIGVKRAFLWMFIRSSPRALKLRNLSFLGPDRMDNLWKAHSEIVVKDHARIERTRGREAFVPLAHPPGHAQADFGEAAGVIGGARQKIHVFCTDAPQSDVCFVKAHPAETAEAFFDGRVSAFVFFGGARLSFLYDNLKIAVAGIYGDGRRERPRAFGQPQPASVEAPASPPTSTKVGRNVPRVRMPRSTGSTLAGDMSHACGAGERANLKEVRASAARRRAAQIA